MIKKENLPEGWGCKNFEELFEFQKKVSHKASEGNYCGKYKFFTSSNIQNKYIDQYDFDGEFIIFGTGGNASIHYCNEKFSTTSDCLISNKLNNEILTKYVYYYFISNIDLLKSGFRGAALKHISKNYIKKIKIKFPLDITLQRKIILALEKTEKLKDIRKNTDELNKDYLKSIFFEMFGDPLENHRKFPIKTLSSILTNRNSIRCGPFGSQLKIGEYVEKGIPVYGIDNIGKNIFLNGKSKYITEEKYKSLTSFKVNHRDILVSRTGTVGRTCVAPNNKKAVIGPNLLIIRCDENILIPEYLAAAFNYSQGIKNQIELFSPGATVPVYNTNNLKKLKLILPPIYLQIKFANILKETEKIKECQTQSKIQIDNLFDCLLQKAFRGELHC